MRPATVMQPPLEHHRTALVLAPALASISRGHTDIVALGEGWTKDPFGADIEGDRIYGRGSCDMKGGLAAAIIAAEAFIEICPDFAGAIEISGTADEETGGFGGVAWLAEKGYFSPDRVDHVHPRTAEQGQNLPWASWRLVGRDRNKGHIAHSSMPFLGDCAVRHMGAVLAEMEEKLFPALGMRQTAMPVVPSRQSTLNNAIRGGLAEPRSAMAFLRRWCLTAA